MPPKKNVEKPAKAPEKALTRITKRMTATSEFKIPTVIKFKLPPIKGLANRVSPSETSPPETGPSAPPPEPGPSAPPLESGPSAPPPESGPSAPPPEPGPSAPPPRTRGQKRKIGMAAARRVELANEVALAQLVKPPAGAAPRGPPEAKRRKQPGRPRARAAADIPTDTGVTETVEAPKKNTRKETTKDSKNIAINKIYVPNKRNADSTSKEPAKKRRVEAAAAVEPPSVLDSEGLAIEGPKASTASSECSPWTKDISSSSASTSITVQSPKEFDRCDNGMPVIKVPFKPPAVEYGEVSSSVSDEVGDTMEGTPGLSSYSSNEEPASNSLELSGSSVTPVKTPHGVDDEMRYGMEILNAKLRELDLLSIAWPKCDPNCVRKADKNLHSNIFRHLKEELNIMRQCKKLRRIFAGNNSDSEGSD